jgi:hypothetical protein
MRGWIKKRRLRSLKRISGSAAKANDTAHLQVYGSKRKGAMSGIAPNEGLNGRWFCVLPGAFQGDTGSFRMELCRRHAPSERARSRPRGLYAFPE